MKFAALLLLVSTCPTADLPNTPPTRVEKRDEGSAAIARCIASSPEEKRITLAATAVHREKDTAIHFRLTNVSREPLRVYPFQLPWGNLNAVQYAAVTSNGETLPVGWPIDDPGPEELIVLAPGKSVEGQVLLRYRITDIDEARARADVSVNWCYHFMLVGEEIGGRLSGVVKVQKRAV